MRSPPRENPTGAETREPGVVYRLQLAERDEERVVMVGRSVRADGASLLALLVFMAAWESFIIFVVSFGKIASAHHRTLLELILAIFFVIPLGFGIWIGPKVPSMLITRAEFLLQEKATVLTYLWWFKRRIPDLPASIEVTSIPGRVGVAAMKFRGRHTCIQLLYTTQEFDVYADAEQRAAEAASEIGGILNVLVAVHKSAAS
jgi:hypothetical protein